MVLLTDRRGARTMPWLRLLALAPISLLLGHQAVFGLQFGFGDALRAAMSAGGHDNYWIAFSVVITTLTGGVLAREIVRAIRLRRRLAGGLVAGRRHGGTEPVGARPTSTPGHADLGTPSWRREFRSMWPFLFALTAIGFTIQENLEHIAAGQSPHGIGSLIGTEHPFAVPVLAAVSAVIAAAGALIRWRVRLLEARVARIQAALSDASERAPRAITPAPEWPLVGAIRGHAWFLVRLLAGRAPPPLA